MSSKFLTYDENLDLLNGSSTLFGSTIGASNLSASMPVKTNANKTLVSEKIQLSDIEGTLLTNPYVGTMEATDFN